MKNMMLILATILFSTFAFARNYSYECTSYYWNGYEIDAPATMVLEVNGDRAFANIMDVSWDDNLGGKLDAQYISYGVIKLIKFGETLLVEGSLLSGGKKLKDGGLGGIARVEGLWNGHLYQYKFICKR